MLGGVEAASDTARREPGAGQSLQELGVPGAGQQEKQQWSIPQLDVWGSGPVSSQESCAAGELSALGLPVVGGNVGRVLQLGKVLWGILQVAVSPH